VFVRENDEHISKERGLRADECASFMSLLKQENGLSDRVQSLENACQQFSAMPSVVLEATESLRAELRHVVGPLQEDVDCLKQANASSKRHDKEFRDSPESTDPERCNSPFEATRFHSRLSNLEAACAAHSQTLAEFQQHVGAVEQGLSAEMQKTWSIVNGQLAHMTQTVELLQKEYVVAQEQTKKLTDSVAHACASSIMKAEASLSRQLVSMKNSDLAIGTAAVDATAVPSPQPSLECQESRLESAITGVHETVAGTLTSRISALELMMPGSSKNRMAQSGTQSRAQSQVPMTLQANSTLATKPHPAIALEKRSIIDRKPAGTPSRLPSAPVIPVRSSLHSLMSVSPHTVSGIPAASKDVVKVRMEGMNVCKAMHGSVRLPASRQP